MRGIHHAYELTMYSFKVHEYEVLTGEEELELAGRYLMGDAEAGLTIIRSNLRMALRISRAYFHHGCNPLEIISAGNIGLVRALKTFDPDKGVLFAHHAEWWVHKYIWSFIQNGHRETSGRKNGALLQNSSWTAPRESPRVVKKSDIPPRNRVIYSLSSRPGKGGRAVVKNPVWQDFSTRM